MSPLCILGSSQRMCWVVHTLSSTEFSCNAPILQKRKWRVWHVTQCAHTTQRIRWDAIRQGTKSFWGQLPTLPALCYWEPQLPIGSWKAPSPVVSTLRSQLTCVTEWLPHTKATKASAAWTHGTSTDFPSNFHLPWESEAPKSYLNCFCSYHQPAVKRDFPFQCSWGYLKMAHNSLINVSEISVVSLSHSFSFFECPLKKRKAQCPRHSSHSEVLWSQHYSFETERHRSAQPPPRRGQAGPLLVGQLVDRLPLQEVLRTVSDSVTVAGRWK